MEKFQADLDGKNFSAIMIAIENLIKINQTLIENDYRTLMIFRIPYLSSAISASFVSVLIFRTVPPRSEGGHFSFERPIPSG